MTTGTITTFYSYEGGVGRSMALANVAAVLAQWGYRVLCIDGDLESPRLHYYFDQVDERHERDGVLELLMSAASPEPIAWRAARSRCRLRGLADVELDLMAAGRLDADYTARLHQLDWEQLYREHGLAKRLEALCASWRREYDYVLIDSPEGTTDTGGALAVQVPDQLVWICNPNRESITNEVDLMRQIKRARQDLPLDRACLPVVPVAASHTVEPESGATVVRHIVSSLSELCDDWIDRNISPHALLRQVLLLNVSTTSSPSRLAHEHELDSEMRTYVQHVENLAALLSMRLSGSGWLVESRDAYLEETRKRGFARREAARSEGANSHAASVSMSPSRFGAVLERQGGRLPLTTRANRGTRTSMLKMLAANTTAAQFWFPGFLAELAKLARTICGADNCSIFLRRGEELYLAATTRAGLRSAVFASAVYTCDQSKIRVASKAFYTRAQRTDRYPMWEGLTAWVGAFGRSLNIRDITDDRLLRAVGDPASDIPVPVWSERNRGPFDGPDAAPRPILIVPMCVSGRAGRPMVVGAIRATTLSAKSAAFGEQAEQRLQGFANELAETIDESGLLADAALDHYFRVWAADTVDALAAELVLRIPELLRVDACSLFLRDSANRFVLRRSSVNAFEHANRDSLYYTGRHDEENPDRSDDSKTGICIRNQRPLILWRDLDGRWTGSDGSEQIDGVAIRSGGSWIGERPTPNVKCEIPTPDSRGLFIVPVPDVMRPRMLAGVLRAVTRKDLDQDGRDEIAEALHRYALGIAEVVSRTWGAQFERDLFRSMISELEGRRRGMREGRGTFKDILCKAAELVCEKLEATAASIFLLESADSFGTLPEFSWLAAKHYRANPERAAAFRQWQDNCRNYKYRPGQGATGFALKLGRITNLHDVRDDVERRALGIGTSPFGECEISDPGPFLAVPICESSTGRVIGVVRTVRRRRSERGAFTPWHEAVLESCADTLSRTLEGVRPRAIISYPTKHIGTMRKIVAQLSLVGVEASYLEERHGGDWQTEFFEKASQANLGIVLAVGEDVVRGPLSVQQAVEVGILRSVLPKTTLFLRQDEVDIPISGPQRVISYDTRQGHGFDGQAVRFQQEVREVVAHLDGRSLWRGGRGVDLETSG